MEDKILPKTTNKEIIKFCLLVFVVYIATTMVATIVSMIATNALFDDSALDKSIYIATVMESVLQIVIIGSMLKKQNLLKWKIYEKDVYVMTYTGSMVLPSNAVRMDASEMRYVDGEKSELAYRKEQKRS